MAIWKEHENTCIAAGFQQSGKPLVPKVSGNQMRMAYIITGELYQYSAAMSSFWREKKQNYLLWDSMPAASLQVSWKISR